jgi:hypothetical protein
MGASAFIPDEQKCQHYAQFAYHLQAVGFDIVYWLLFMAVMLMLFISSWYYGRYGDARLVR